MNHVILCILYYLAGMALVILMSVYPEKFRGRSVLTFIVIVALIVLCFLVFYEFFFALAEAWVFCP